MEDYRVYNGMCIGGPAAGKYISHEAPYYRVAVLDRLPPIVSHSPDIEAAPLPVYDFGYEWVRGLTNNDGRNWDFWVPSDVMRAQKDPLPYVLDTLFDHYHERVRR